MLLALVAMSVSLELMLDALVVMLEALVAISVSLELMLLALVAISESLELIFVLLVLMLDSTSDTEPSVSVPSISASFKIVTVPEVWPNERSPVEKSPVMRSLSTELSSSYELM